MGFCQPNDQGAEKVSVELTRDMWNFIRCGILDNMQRLTTEMDAEANPVDKEDIRVVIEENQDVLDMMQAQIGE